MIEQTFNTNCGKVQLHFYIYKNIVFPAEAEYSYFSAGFRLKIFLRVLLDNLQRMTFPLNECIKVLITLLFKRLLFLRPRLNILIFLPILGNILRLQE